MLARGTAAGKVHATPKPPRTFKRRERIPFFEWELDLIRRWRMENVGDDMIAYRLMRPVRQIAYLDTERPNRRR